MTRSFRGGLQPPRRPAVGAQLVSSAGAACWPRLSGSTCGGAGTACRSGTGLGRPSHRRRGRPGPGGRAPERRARTGRPASGRHTIARRPPAPRSRPSGAADTIVGAAAPPPPPPRRRSCSAAAPASGRPARTRWAGNRRTGRPRRRSRPGGWRSRTPAELNAFRLTVRPARPTPAGMDGTFRARTRSSTSSKRWSSTRRSLQPRQDVRAAHRRGAWTCSPTASVTGRPAAQLVGELDPLAEAPTDQDAARGQLAGVAVAGRGDRGDSGLRQPRSAPAPSAPSPPRWPAQPSARARCPGRFARRTRSGCPDRGHRRAGQYRRRGRIGVLEHCSCDPPVR